MLLRARIPVVLVLLTGCAGGCSKDTFRPDESDDPTAFGDDDDPVSSDPAPIGCEEPAETPDPGLEGSASCITEVIACGETVRGTNAGGSTVFGAEPGEAFSQCAGSASQTDELAGPERVYELPLDGEIRDLQVRLESCEKSLLLYYQGEACATSPVSCNYPFEGTYYIQTADVALSNTEYVYFVVEGVNNDGGNFELTVDCF